MKIDPIISDWLITVNPSKNAERNYLLSIRTFCDWTKKTLEELLTVAEEEIKAGKLMRQRKIKSYLLGFRKDLLDRGLAPMTIRVYMAGVKSFYQINDIELPILPR